jgi:hypothetical protein
MKVGDLVKRRTGRHHGKFLVVRKEINIRGYDMVWIYPDLEPDSGYDHTDEDNYYFADLFEVVSESR